MSKLSPWSRRRLPVLSLLLALFTLLSGTPPAGAQAPLPAPPPIRDIRFGAVEAYDAPGVATAAGVGWTRVLFWWHQVQPGGPDDWNPHYFPDGMLNQELGTGREMVGLLAGTPAWASKSGSVRAVPDGLYLPYDDPGNLWGRYVYRMAQTYAGRINHWIIWNEPDVWDDDHPGKTWDGTVEDYVQLLRVAYEASRAANGNAVIHLAATTHWWDEEHGRELYFLRLLDAIHAHPEAKRLNGFFDIASLHLYFKPAQVYEVTRLYRAELNRRGFADKPLWINETNAPPSTDPLHPAPGLRFPITLEEQSYFLVQAWASGLAAGAQRIALYKTRDERSLPAGVEPYGMMRKDGSIRPVFWTYRALVTYLGGFERAQLNQEGAIRRVVVWRGDVGTTTVLWNTGATAQTIEVAARANDARLVGPYGESQIIRREGASYRLTLPPSRGGEIGGTPFMIVEGAGARVVLEVPDSMQVAMPSPDGGPPPPLTMGPPVAAPAPGAVEWSVPGGRFFTQAAAEAGGFAVVDDAQARFWSEYQRLGGAQTVGYPISRRYLHDGFITQAFQKLVLQWRPEVGAAWPVNIFDELSADGLDRRLLASRQTPLPLKGEEVDPSGATWEEIVIARQALLNENPVIRNRYFSLADPLTVFGLPTSRVEDMGNHFALRTQRALFQQWKETVPWAAAGEVTIANGGDIAKEVGWLPRDALLPQPVAWPE